MQPECDPASERSAKRAAKGAQYILHQARPYSSLAHALEDTAYAVAFSRWDPGTNTPPALCEPDQGMD